MTDASDVPADEALLRRIAQQDRAAFEALYRRHRGRLLAASFRLVGDSQAAEEVLQDALVTVWQRAASFEGRSSVRTWLHAIVRNHALNLRRRSVLVSDGAAELVALPAPGPGPEDAVLALAREAELAAILDELAPRHREVLTLVFFCELSHVEIGKALGIPVGTVKSRLYMAKRELASRLIERDKETAP